MKNLGKVIDQLIKIDSGLEKPLKPIRSKWKRFPKREKIYWNELLTYLNSGELIIHPKRDKMRDIINTPSKRKRFNYSFGIISQRDTIIGPITGKLADKIRRLDLRSIKIAKEHVEANMTHNTEKQAEIIRKMDLLDIETKKIWVAVRDHFKLWAKPGNYNFKISAENNMLYLVEPFILPQINSSGVIKMDPEMLRKFFNYIGMEPPPDLLGGKR